MAVPTGGAVTLWVAARHHPAYACGGWAFVREDAGKVAGSAGGERRVTDGKMALAGLSAGVRDLRVSPSGSAGPVTVITDSPALAALARVLAGDDVDMQLEGHAELWAPILAVRTGRKLVVRRQAAEPDSPLAFAGAWADLAMDKAKSRGPFVSPIPQNNLSKLTGLTAGR